MFVVPDASHVLRVFFDFLPDLWVFQRLNNDSIPLQDEGHRLQDQSLPLQSEGLRLEDQDVPAANERAPTGNPKEPVTKDKDLRKFCALAMGLSIVIHVTESIYVILAAKLALADLRLTGITRRSGSSSTLAHRPPGGLGWGWGGVCDPLYMILMPKPTEC